MGPGKPDAGKPLVRFDEGREVAGHWLIASQPVTSRLLYTARAVAGGVQLDATNRRIEYPGAFYHVMARGNRREDIFKDEIDRMFFLES